MVDSGADHCLFPASVGRAIGIPIPNPNTYVFSGTAEAPQLAYFEVIQLMFWGRVAAEQPLRFDLYAGFCETLEHVGLGLLGQDGFFSRFQVHFHYQQNYFDVF